jgi:two-component system, NtrC family, response regulator PilR
MKDKEKEMSFQTYREQMSRKERILIVDDEAQIREVLSEYFGKMGYEIETAKDGEEALSKFKPDLFDCVISDIAMPGISGEELLKRLKAKDPTVLFLIITGHPSIESAVETIKLGAYDYVAKPLRLKELHIKVERALYTRQLEKAVRATSERLRRLMVVIPVLLVLAIVLGIIWKQF